MMLEKTGGESLPDGYTALEYIQSSGTQYIDTGHKLTQDSDITIDFQIIGTLDKNAGIFGSRESSTKNNLALFQNYSGASSLTCDFSEYLKHRVNIYKTFNRIKIQMNKNGVWADDVPRKSWNDIADFETPTNGLIFDVGTNNWTGNKVVMRLYSYTDGDAQKFVPCLDANGVPCLYDLISKTTFYNQGSGSFTWG
nr:MAG TPA: hypothetical protein [Caudoviricetes sp.]